MKTAAKWIVGVIVGLSVLWVWLSYPKVAHENIKWGITYSEVIAEELLLDPKETYFAILDELKPEQIRLVAYWDRIEKEPGKFDFSFLDYLIDEADKRGIEYVLVAGRRVPRYPECFEPNWVKELPKQEQKTKVLNFVRAVIERYDDRSGLLAWQIENEPLLPGFGRCPAPDEEQLIREVSLANRLTSKDIIVSDSGERSFWIRSGKYADIFGTTMYRSVINQNTKKVFRHFLPPSAYTVRANLLKRFFGVKDVIVVELQAEPWAEAPLVTLPKDFLDVTMDHEQFEDNIKFAERAGLSNVYLWGAEWWYQQKQTGDSYFWERGKEILEPAMPL